MNELDLIWRWNAENYNAAHASRYLAFLRSRIDDLRFSFSGSTSLGARPDLRYMLIRRHSSGHGHVAVFANNDDIVEVLHVFHTAQDWQGTLSAEEP